MSTEAYCDKVARLYGVAGDSSYPAPGSNGPAQTLYDHHQKYVGAQNGPVVEGSDSWPGSQNPMTQKIVP